MAEAESGRLASLQALLEQAERDEQGLPPVHQWNPPFNGDIDMRIARDGTWYYQGGPILRKPLVRLFSTVLKREKDRYFLVTPVEKVGIQVDDAPFVAVTVDRGDGRGGADGRGGGSAVLVFTTNVGSAVVAGPGHPIRVETRSDGREPAPYLRVRDNLDALISRNTFYQLVEMGHTVELDGDTWLAVESQGEQFLLGRMD